MDPGQWRDKVASDGTLQNCILVFPIYHHGRKCREHRAVSVKQSDFFVGGGGVKLGKPASETLEIPNTAYEEAALLFSDGLQWWQVCR